MFFVNKSNKCDIYLYYVFYTFSPTVGSSDVNTDSVNCANFSQGICTGIWHAGIPFSDSGNSIVPAQAMAMPG